MGLLAAYDQWDPCGEGEQFQVPQCKHLRGPDLDCTHSNTCQESQAKTVPSATAEEIQGLTSNPENLSGPVLIYISLLIISCIIEYVTNKRTLNLEP